MANEWFRMYSEFSTDAKVQSMPEAMQRRLTMILCLRCSNALVTLHDDEIAFALRITEEELVQTKALFVRKGFIDESWEIKNWNKRQFVSDSSKERVSKHRATKKAAKNQGETINATPCNVTVTPPDTEQNRTDTEVNTHVELKPDLDVSQKSRQVTVTKPAQQESVSMNQVHDVFEYWKSVMDSPRSILDDKRKKRIKKALGSFSSHDLLQAIRGCRNSPFHMGDNDRKTRYNGIDVIFRDAAQVEKFMTMDNGIKAKPINETAEERNERISREFLGGDDDENIIDMAGGG